MTPAVNDRIWDDLRRPTPAWLPAAKLGIFIHWGPYSVPAWAEPSGALGAVPESEWFKHNAYAEWYFNTIRIPDSPAAQHHHDVYHDAPYDDFLDQWTAAKFDPAAWARAFAEAGATYVVPTTKHHDGVALWDAPRHRYAEHRSSRSAARSGWRDRRSGPGGRPTFRRVLLRRSGLEHHRPAAAHLAPGRDDFATQRRGVQRLRGVARA